MLSLFFCQIFLDKGQKRIGKWSYVTSTFISQLVSIRCLDSIQASAIFQIFFFQSRFPFNQCTSKFLKHGSEVMLSLEVFGFFLKHVII